MTHLLAYDGTADNQRQGKLGKILHDFSKWMIRGFSTQLHKKMLPVIEYKKKNGWIKEHITAMDEGWKWVMSLDELPLNKGIGGFKGADDKNRKFFSEIGDIAFTHLDEDTHYDIRMLLWLKWVHEHWGRFEQSAESAYQLLNFGELYKDLLALSEPLPLDDGKDDFNEDYTALEKRLSKTEKGNDPHVME